MGKLIHLLVTPAQLVPAGRGGRGQVSFCFPPPPPPPVSVCSLGLVRVQVVLTCEISEKSCCQVNYCHRSGSDAPKEIKKRCSVGRHLGGSFFIDEETLTEVPARVSVSSTKQHDARSSAE